MTMTNKDRVIELMRTSQTHLCNAFEALDGAAQFTNKTWDRPGGGGGTARVMSAGAVFEKAGINTSAVHGEQTPPTRSDGAWDRQFGELAAHDAAFAGEAGAGFVAPDLQTDVECGRDR